MSFPPIMILIFALMACVVVGWRTRIWFNPVSVMISWWAFWAWVATYQFTGLFPISPTVQVMVLVMIAGFAFGAVLPHPGMKSPPDRLSPEPDLLALRYDRVNRGLVITSLLMVVPAFLRGLYGMYVMYGTESNYRQEAFGTVGHPGYIFRSNVLESVYFLISSPLVLALLIFGIGIFFQTGRYKTLAWAIALTVMDSIMRFARNNIYLICILVFASFMMLIGVPKAFGGRPKDVLIRFSKAFMAVLILFSIVVGIGFVRRDTTTFVLKEQFDIYVVDYHTVGFVFVSQDLERPQTDLASKKTYGRLTFGGLETLATIVIRQFRHDYMSPALENAVKFSENRLSGYKPGNDEPRMKKVYNSYYTILYTFYSDAGWAGLFFGGLALGWLTMWAYRAWLLSRHLEPFVWTLFLLNIVLLGLFVSPLEITRTWLFVIGMGVLHYWPSLRAGVLKRV